MAGICMPEALIRYMTKKHLGPNFRGFRQIENAVVNVSVLNCIVSVFTLVFLHTVWSGLKMRNCRSVVPGCPAANWHRLLAVVP